MCACGPGSALLYFTAGTATAPAARKGLSTWAEAACWCAARGRPPSPPPRGGAAARVFELAAAPTAAERRRWAAAISQAAGLPPPPPPPRPEQQQQPGAAAATAASPSLPLSARGPAGSTPAAAAAAAGKPGRQAPGPNRVASPLAGCGPVRHAPEAAPLRHRPR